MRMIPAVACLFTLAGLAVAQDVKEGASPAPATQRAAAQPAPVYGKPIATGINPGQMITYRSTNQDISAYLVTPKVTGKTPAVIYVHDIYGMTDFAKGEAEKLARQGYTVLAPNLYSRVENSAHGFNAQGAWVAYDKTPDAQVVQDLLHAIDYLTKDDKTDDEDAGNQTRVGVVGHDMGGIYAMMMAGEDLRVAAAVNYYGRIMYSSTSKERPTSPVDDIFNLQAPLLSFYGDIDPQIPAVQVRTLESRLENNPNKTFYQVVMMPHVGHSFLVPTRPGYDQAAAKEAEKKTRDFLAHYLRAAPKKIEE